MRKSRLCKLKEPIDFFYKKSKEYRKGQSPEIFCKEHEQRLSAMTPKSKSRLHSIK